MTTTFTFERHPNTYKHWKLSFDGELATLAMDVREDGADDDYTLKLNSYDLNVDIELRDAVERIRFEHPEVKCVVVTGAKDRVFCAGANIFMLGASTHAFKVNFCKYTNETRLGIEDASSSSDIKFLCAANGTASGGGYELALACDEIMLIDDANSAVSFPEVPLLAVLPGTGGLTRITDKRKVRRDLCDAFSTVAEGIKGKRAVEWGLVDAIAPKSKWNDAVRARAGALAKTSARRSDGKGVILEPLAKRIDGNAVDYTYVSLVVDKAERTATVTMRAPAQAEPHSAAKMREKGSDLWCLKAYRELDDALMHLRINHLEIGLLVLRTEGETGFLLSAEQTLLDAVKSGDWFAGEVLHHMKRVLKHLDTTSKTLLALVEPRSCFCGSLAELLWAADRSYMLDDENGDGRSRISITAMNDGPLPMGNGLTRLATRFLGNKGALDDVKSAIERQHTYLAEDAEDAGIVTFVRDDIDYPDEVRLFVEERTSLSPDALTGMEANLRFAGPETMETKIFGRLSAWQNWIFIRPNATGEQGALTNYGRPSQPVFDMRRC